MIEPGVWVWGLCISCGIEYQVKCTDDGAKLQPRCWRCGEVITFAGTGVTAGPPTDRPSQSPEQ